MLLFKDMIIVPHKWPLRLLLGVDLLELLGILGLLSR